MGLTGGLVKSVFSKNRSVRSHDTNVVMSNCVVDKKRWSTVRSYLCGDEFNSVVADADSASLRTSDATVTQPVLVQQDCEEDGQSENRDDQIMEEEEMRAATVIQSAFRSFLVRREDEARKEEEERLGSEESFLGSSVEVETGGSPVQTLSLKEEERVSVQHQRARSHYAKLKEDWDDSTVSSNVSKSRIQSRLEATTRRERALAYAFSQQLRVCSKKKATSQSEVVNMGWSWLERWMATRPLETLSVEDRISRQNEPGHLAFLAVKNKKNFEEESCGSNEVSVKMNHLTITAPDEIRYNHHKPGKNRLKAAKTVSRRKTVPSSPQDTRNDFFKEAGKRSKSTAHHLQTRLFQKPTTLELQP